ncbi:hypothetical protein PINS_up000278 [Pythium insidiosum]|nr:hypothetical protein PINS_up000278 [Pythium insidiosum]
MTVIAEATARANASASNADAIKSGVRDEEAVQDSADSDRLSDVSSVVSSVDTSCLADDELLELSSDDEECDSLASSSSSDRDNDH